MFLAVLLMGHASAAGVGAKGVEVVLEAVGNTHAEETTGAVASSALQPATPDSTDVDSGHLEGRFEETQTRRSTRVARKLGVGLLSGSVLTIVGRHQVEFAHSIGPGAGAMVGVVLVDPPRWSSNRRSSLLALAGSSVGVLAGSLIVPDPSSTSWYRLLLPPLGATISSELWRDPSQVSRLPIADARREKAIDLGGPRERIAKKLGAGAGVGILSGLAAGGILLGSADLGQDGIGAPFVFAVGWLPGSMLGTAYGVSHLDAYDRFSMALFGSLLGSVAGIWGTDFSGSGWLDAWPLFVCPAAGATITSELSRNPPEPGGFTISLMPGFGRHVSMVVALSF